MEYTTVKKTAEKWGVSHQRVHQLCQAGRIPGAVYEKKHWRIPADAEKPLGINKPGFLTVTEMARKWGVYTDKVTHFCELRAIPGVMRSGKRWFIPEDAKYPQEGYILVSEMAEKWGMSRVVVSRYCKEGRIPGAKQVGRNWYIPAEAPKPADAKVSRMPGYISAAKMAEKWGIPRSNVSRLCQEGRVPGAIQDGRYWHIPENLKKATVYIERAKKDAN